MLISNKKVIYFFNINLIDKLFFIISLFSNLSIFANYYLFITNFQIQLFYLGP